MIQYNNVPLTGIGFIYIPMDIDRDDFVKKCFVRQQVSIMLEAGGAFHNCYITKECLQDVIFPQENGKLGSRVVYVSPETSSSLMVVGVFPEPGSCDFLEENQKMIRTKNGQSEMNLIFNPNENIAILNLVGTVPQKFYVNLASGEGSLYRLFSGGNIEMIANESISTKSFTFNSTIVKDMEGGNEATIFMDKDSVSLKYNESEIDIQDKNIEISVPDKVTINPSDDSQPATLADATSEKLQKIQNWCQAIYKALVNATVGVQDGGQMLQKSIITALSKTDWEKMDFEDIKSKNLEIN